MKAWGEGVVQRLHALGLPVDGCTADEERVVFVPDGRLTLSFDASRHVEVALQLPPRDLPALRARLADADRALELTTVIEALPEQFEAGAAGDGPRIQASGVTADELRALLERVEQQGQALWLGWRVSRAAAVAHAALLDDLLEDALVALGGLLALLAWTPALASLPRSVHADRRDRARHDEDSRAARGKHRARARVRNPRDGDPEGEPEAERESEVDSAVSPARLPRAANAGVPLRPGPRRRPLAPSLAAVDPRVPIDKGVRVRILEGPFAGKVGLVQKLDGRGGARVMLGLLAVRLDVKDVVACAEGRGRPLLSSSHRKPLPARRVRS
jgi:hypothetical protein